MAAVSRISCRNVLRLRVLYIYYNELSIHIILTALSSLLAPWLVLVKLRENCSSPVAASSRGAVTSIIVTSNSGLRVISGDSHSMLSSSVRVDSMLSSCVRVRRGDTWSRGVKTKLTWRLGRVLETGLHQAGVT